MRDRLTPALWFTSGVLVTLAAIWGPRLPVAFADQATPSPTAAPATPAPSIWDRAVGAVSETTEKYTNDEAIADYVMASLQKQDRVNRILHKRGSRFRISDMRVSFSVPPALEVGVAELAEPAEP